MLSLELGKDVRSFFVCKGFQVLHLCYGLLGPFVALGCGLHLLNSFWSKSLQLTLGRLGQFSLFFLENDITLHLSFSASALAGVPAPSHGPVLLSHMVRIVILRDGLVRELDRVHVGIRINIFRHAGVVRTHAFVILLG